MMMLLCVGHDDDDVVALRGTNDDDIVAVRGT